MNAELEALVLALEAVIEGKGSGDTKQLEALYEARLDEVLERHPGVSREALVEIVDRIMALAQRQQKVFYDPTQSLRRLPATGCEFRV